MEWALTFAAFVIGGVFGYVGHTLMTKNNRHKNNNEQLEQTQLELSQYKQEVSDHFDDHYKQLAELTAQLNRVNQQWNASASLFTSPATDKQLPELGAPNTTEKSDEKPEALEEIKLTAV